MEGTGNLEPLEKKKQETLEKWMESLAKANLPKLLLNRLILNFLIVEGYKAGAFKFIKESGIDIDSPDSKQLLLDLREPLIDLRMEVRKSIELGNIAAARSLINEIEPSLMNRNLELNFELRKQELIELIRQKRITEAIHYAQSQVSPICQENSSFHIESAQAFEFRNELNEVMTLIIYFKEGDDTDFEEICKSMNPALRTLVSKSNRQSLASHVNEIILEAMGYQSEHQIGVYWQMTQWSQSELASFHKDEQTNKDLSYPILKKPMGSLEMEADEEMESIYDSEEEETETVLTN